MTKPSAIYGIIGDPVKHSLSPIMHNTAFKQLKVDAEYQLFPVKENELDEFFAAIKKKDSPIFGLNVTVPYKEKAMKYMDLFTPLVEKIGAVNTVVVGHDRKLKGFNTDAPGFLAHLAELKCDTTDKRVSIIGAGGSSRAIITSLCLIPERPQKIKLYNRTAERMDALLEEIGSRIDISIVEPVHSIDDLDIELADVLINTTSVGLKKDDELLIDPELIHSDMFVYDLIYNPKETALLKLAREKGARTSNGLGMLFYQGVLAFQHWANIQLSEPIKMKMRQSLEGAVKG